MPSISVRQGDTRRKNLICRRVSVAGSFSQEMLTVMKGVLPVTCVLLHVRSIVFPSRQQTVRMGEDTLSFSE
jgi:hypothetical protein